MNESEEPKLNINGQRAHLIDALIDAPHWFAVIVEGEDARIFSNIKASTMESAILTMMVQDPMFMEILTHAMESYVKLTADPRAALLKLSKN